MIFLTKFHYSGIVYKVMELSFASSSLEAAAKCSRLLDKLFGTNADRAKQRLYELASAPNLDALRALPALRFERVPHSAHFRVCVAASRYIEFEPVLTSRSKRVRDADLEAVTSIRILSLD